MNDQTDTAGADGASRFQQLHREHVYAFAVGFEAWLADVSKPLARTLPGGPQLFNPPTIGTLLAADAAEREASQRASDELHRAQVEAITDHQFNLAQLCRGFVIRELLAWARFQRERAVPIADVLSTIAADCDLPALLADTRAYKWELGLLWLRFGARGDPFNVFGSYHAQQGERDYRFGADVWRLAVEDGVASFLADDLPGYLENESQPLAVLDDRNRNRDAVARFVARVGRENSHAPTMRELAMVAGPRGYATLSELHAFKRGELDARSSTYKNFAALLAMSSSDFTTQLDRRRLLLVQRREELDVAAARRAAQNGAE